MAVFDKNLLGYVKRSQKANFAGKFLSKWKGLKDLSEISSNSSKKLNTIDFLGPCIQNKKKYFLMLKEECFIEEFIG